jgi:hypothetical protein
MGKINMGRVILGGLLAGVFLYISEFVLQGVILRGAWEEAQKAIGKSSADMNMTTSMIIYALWSLVLGIGSVWVYAGIRPRFGAGPGTAVRAGLAVWAVGSVAPALVNVASAVWPTQLLCTGMAAELILFPVAVVIGAAPYKESA